MIKYDEFLEEYYWYWLNNIRNIGRRKISKPWGLLKYLQCNKANAEKFQNIFMWNALILVLVEMPKFQFHVAFNN